MNHEAGVVLNKPPIMHQGVLFQNMYGTTDRCPMAYNYNVQF